MVLTADEPITKQFLLTPTTLDNDLMAYLCQQPESKIRAQDTISYFQYYHKTCQKESEGETSHSCFTENIMTTNILNHQQTCMLGACCLVLLAWRLQATPNIKNKFCCHVSLIKNRVFY